MKALIDRISTIFNRITKYTHLSLLLLFIAAGLLRVMYSGNFSFGFDQVQILENAGHIIEGDFTLIGPRTGPAAMFTGPLIYYLAAPFVWLFGDMATVVLVPLLISVVTGMTLFLLSQRYLGKQQAWIMTILWAFSPFIVSLDRVFWNPNLTLLASLLLFLPLLGKKTDSSTYFFVFLGSFLAYQAHFSGFVLLMLAAVSILYVRKPWQLLISLVMGTALSLLPTILFDLRNNFLNARGLLELFSTKSSDESLQLLENGLHNLYIVIETAGKLFVYGNSAQLIFVTGLVVFVLSLRFHTDVARIKLAFLWFIITIVVYSVYQGEKPEYYFLLLTPALLVIASELLQNIEKKALTAFLLVFGFCAVLTSVGMHSKANGLTTGVLEDMNAYLHQHDVKEIHFDVPFGSDYGARYYFKDIVMEESGEIFHISYPNELAFRNIKKYSDAAVWKDNRKDTKNNITEYDVIIATNAQYFLYQNKYPSATSLKTYSYVLAKEVTVVGEVYVSPISNDAHEWVKTCKDTQKVEEGGEWFSISNDQHISRIKEHCILIKSDFQHAVGSQIEIL